MEFSQDRASHMAHLIIEGIQKRNVGKIRDVSIALRETKKVIEEFGIKHGNLDELVKNKIRSLSRPIPEGSNEWEILYQKYYEEEVRKHGKRTSAI